MTASSLESQLQTFRKKIDSAARSRKKQVVALRAKAAEAALSWVMSHESRVEQFRSAVAGTPVAGALDKLLDLLKAEAHPAAPARKKAVKKAAAKKVAKKATKKVAKKAAKKAAPAKTAKKATKKAARKKA